MSKFKIGDRVKSIGELCSGEIGVIIKIDDTTTRCPYYVDFGSEIWWKKAETLELVNLFQQIHITVEDRTTHAILKQGNQVIKRAQAICNPSDEFNFEIGANIAFQRLVGSEVRHRVKGVKRQANVGEWIKIVNAYATRNKYSNGEVLQVRESVCGKRGTFDHVTVTNEDLPVILTTEYVVLENYQPQQEPFDITKVSDEDLLNEVHRRMELK